MPSDLANSSLSDAGWGRSQVLHSTTYFATTVLMAKAARDAKRWNHTSCSSFAGTVASSPKLSAEKLTSTWCFTVLALRQSMQGCAVRRFLAIPTCNLSDSHVVAGKDSLASWKFRY